jgi:hypothetical protein
MQFSQFAQESSEITVAPQLVNPVGQEFSDSPFAFNQNILHSPKDEKLLRNIVINVVF